MSLLSPVSDDRRTEMAAAISDASQEKPLFEGADGPRMTAALLVAVAWSESNFEPAAVGDGGLACTAWQVHAGRRCPALTADIHEAAREARERMRASLYRCRRRPLPERLAEYCSGSCDRGGAAASRRWGVAFALLRTVRLRPSL